MLLRGDNSHCVDVDYRRRTLSQRRLHMINLFRKGLSMFKPLATGFLAVSLLFSASGCTTLADARAGQGTGQVRVYDASWDKVWNTIPVVLKDLGLKEEGYHKGTGYVVAQSKVPMLRALPGVGVGENIAIFVDKADSPNQTKVEVVAKNKFAVDAFANKWEDKVHEQLKTRLAR
jgi:hypothetical protein